MAKSRRNDTLESLERSLASGELLPVYLLVGEEQFLRHRARNLIHDVIVEKHGGTVTVLGPDDPLETVLEELRGDSLFASRRMVELVQAEGFLREQSEALVRYLARPSASGVLVIDATKVDRRTNLPKTVRATGMLVDCPRIYEDKLPRWVRAEVGRRGLKIATAAVSLLVDEVGNNLFALSTEIEKLVTYVGDRKAVEVHDVAQLTGHTRSWVIWALTDALGQRDVASALRVLESLLREGMWGEQIVGSLNWQITRLWRGKVFLEGGGSPREIGARLHVGPKYVESLIEQIRRFSRDDLARLSRMLLEVDITLKSAGLPVRMVLERFLVEACGGVSVAH